MSRELDERRAQHQRYKEDVKERGKPFYPYAMFHDTVMSLVVVGVIIGLAVIWKVTAGEDPNKPGLLGPLYAEPADPGTTNFVPRPDWYFYFLFYLLRIFKWPDTVILGTVGIPTVALVLLPALPFLDRRRERRVLRRPVAVGAPDLSAIGKAQQASFFARYVSNRRKFSNNIMPMYGQTYSKAQIAQIAAFLAASKGPH